MVELGKNHTLIWSNWGNRIFIGKRYCFFNSKTGKRFLKLFKILLIKKKGVCSLFLSHAGEKSTDETGVKEMSYLLSFNYYLFGFCCFCVPCCSSYPYLIWLLDGTLIWSPEYWGKKTHWLEPTSGASRLYAQATMVMAR